MNEFLANQYEESKLLVLYISRMSIHNGPGMRTLVHLKGCPLRCLWCSTPESQKFEPQLAYDKSKCILCLRCIDNCEADAIYLKDNHIEIDRRLCTDCGDCTKVCHSKALWEYGQYMSAKELVDEIVKDRLFFKHSGGGVTLSGGEPLAHVDKIMELIQLLKKENIRIGVDTTGYLPQAKLAEALPYIDFFLWDVKCMDTQKHKELTGVDNSLIFENLKFVSEQGVAVYLRYPVIPGMNDSEQELRAVCNFAKDLTSLVQIDLLPVHHLGRARYASLGSEYPLENIALISDEAMHEMKHIVESYGLKCTIGG